MPNISRNSIDDEIINCRTRVYKKDINEYEKDISKVYEFIKIFKPELKGIEIDKKDDGDTYVCDLIFNYIDYKVNAKLIRVMFAIISKMYGNL